jgi:hypothetical protein
MEEVLENKIKHVQTFTDQLMHETLEDKTDELLDGANMLKKRIVQLTRNFDDLNEDLFIYANNNEKQALDNLENIKFLLLDVNEFIAGLKRDRTLYSILKEEIKDLNIASSQLKEIIQDIKMKYIDFPKNKELQNLLRNINDQF